MQECKKTIGVYSGTFDPFTKGHMDIVKRSLKIYDMVIIAVAISSAKKPMFTIKQRIRFIQKALKGYKNIQVVQFSNLLVDFVQDNGTYNIIRGIRNIQDFEYELNMSYANVSLNSKINTAFFTPKLKHQFISSSLVRELLRFDGDIKHLVPKQIFDNIHKKYKKNLKG